MQTQGVLKPPRPHNLTSFYHLVEEEEQDQSGGLVCLTLV